MTTTEAKSRGEFNAMSPRDKERFRSEAEGIEKVRQSLSKLFKVGFCDPRQQRPDGKDSTSSGTAKWIIDNDWNDSSPSKSQDRAFMEIPDATGRTMPLISPLSSAPREPRSAESRSLEVTKKQLFPSEAREPPGPSKGCNWLEQGFIFAGFAVVAVYYCVYLSNIEAAMEPTKFTESLESTKTQVPEATSFLETCPAPAPNRNVLPTLSEERVATNKPSPLQQGKSRQVPLQLPVQLSNASQFASEVVQWLIPLILTFVIPVWIVLAVVLRQAAIFAVDKHA